MIVSNSQINMVESVPMATRRRKSRLGGARPGAGRKPFLKDTKALTVTLEGADYEAIDKLAEKRGVSLGTIVREAVQAYMARRRKR